MSRLVGMQTNKHNGKTHICLNCFNTFSLEKSFKEHIEVCLSNEAVKINMPKKGSCIEFNKFGKKLKVPFVVYADFESYTEHITENGVTPTTPKATRRARLCRIRRTRQSRTRRNIKNIPQVDSATTLCIVEGSTKSLLYTQDQMLRKSFVNILKWKHEIFTINILKMLSH